MEIAHTAWQVLSAALVFLLGVLVSIKIGAAFVTSGKRSLILYLWHSLLCFIYVLYVLDSGGDALSYYQRSLYGGITFSLGTAAIEFITTFFSSGLGLSVLGTFLVYNLFGFIGLLAFDATLQSATADKSRQIRRFATFIVFLPSVSFWSSAIGKDAISFMAAGLALWAAQHLKQRAWLMALAIALMLLVRPHIAALMVMAVAVSMMVQPRVSLKQRLLVGGLALATAVVMVPVAMTASGLADNAGIAEVTDFVDLRQSYNLEGGGGIDIASMSLPMKLFTYLLRPLPFEAHSILSLAASLDNVVLLWLVLVGAWQMLHRRPATGVANRVFLWVYAISAWLILAMTTANLGISTRQKWMFAPMLIYLFISVIGKPRRRVPDVHDDATGSPHAAPPSLRRRP